jgi:hypothetical protein
MDFTVVAIPDIQNLAQYYPSTLNTMMQAIVNNSTTCAAPFCPASGQWNIEAVLGEGDNVNATDTAQMTVSQTAWNYIAASNIPFLIAIGNHDYDNISERNTTTFDKFFGPSYYAAHFWYGGGFPANSNANSYALVTLGGYPFVLLSMEFYPRCTATGIFATVCAGSTIAVDADAASWAEGVLTANSERQAIIVTHAYLDSWPDTHRMDDSDPTVFGVAGPNWLNGVEMNSTIVQHSSVALVVNGHFPNASYSAHIAPQETNSVGALVSEVFSNYQNDMANSWIALFKFRPSLGQIEVYHYSVSLAGFDPNFPMYTLQWNPKRNRMAVERPKDRMR